MQRRDGPGSRAVQHSDGKAGAPPRGVAIGARIERAGCCAAPLARRSSSTSRIGRRGVRRTHARLCERRGVCPPVVACATAAVKARSAANTSRRSLTSAVDATCSASSVFRGGGARSVVTTGGGGGSRRAQHVGRGDRTSATSRFCFGASDPQSRAVTRKAEPREQPKAECTGINWTCIGGYNHLAFTDWKHEGRRVRFR